MKGTAKQGTVSNIKPMEGGVAIASLPGGQYVYGDLSPTGSDIINFTHYYKADGTKVELSKPCKVFIGNNLIVTNENEPTTDPETPTDPDPEVPQFPASFVLTEPNGAKAEYILSRIITEL